MEGGESGTKRFFETSKLIRRSFLAVAISLGSVLSVFLWMHFQGEQTTLTLRFPFYLLPAFTFVFLSWFTDALRLVLITRAWQKGISFRNALTVVLSTHFLAGVTPSNTGGGAAEIYLLHKLGFTWGEAGSLSLSCGLLYQVGFLVLFLLVPAAVPFSLFFRTMLFIFLAYGIGLALFFVLSQNRRILPSLIEKMVKIPKRYFPRYARYNEKMALEAALDFLNEFRSGFQLIFFKKPYYFALNIGFYTLHFFFTFAITYFIILTIGGNLPLFEVVKLQIPTFFLFRLTPTPGGSGGIELALTSTFAPFLGDTHAGTLVFLWRIFSYYLTLVVGGITFLRSIRKV
ncbi:MAG: lysylphosphatidylglycerol synthase transmembrane domain-containing protein [Atribacterota bacterium]